MKNVQTYHIISLCNKAILRKAGGVLRSAAFLVLFTPGLHAVEGPTPQQVAVMQEEHRTMGDLRHRLRWLLEQQEQEDTLGESDDAFQDLQTLEQWLEELRQNPDEELKDQVMEMLAEFEQQLQEMLQQQEDLAAFLPQPPQEAETPQLPVDSLMEALKQLLEENRIQEAQELLNQMLSALNQQQQQLQQQLQQHYEERFSEAQRQLQELQRQLQQAMQQQQQVQQQLQPHADQQSMPPQERMSAEELQQRISEMIRQMQEMLANLDSKQMLAGSQSAESLMQQGRESSEQTQQSIGQGPPGEAMQGANQTQQTLGQLQQSLSQMQQQAQQMSRPNLASRARRETREGRGYWSEKGIRPLKFDYDFEANPSFREEIMKRNQQGGEGTLRQQRYLEEIIK